jgi:dTDP-4-dehydrorhamnose 3,5-epimerase-like enzyme
MDEPHLIPAFTHSDARGRLMEVAEWESGSRVNVKMSVSRAGALRGLHYQADPYAQAKIVRVCCGVILDVAVNLSTGDLYEARLSSVDPFSLYIPVGFAHGFKAEVDDTAVVYLSANRYDAASERAFNPLLRSYGSFSWGSGEDQMMLSTKDRSAPDLEIRRGARHFRMSDGAWTLVSSA